MQPGGGDTNDNSKKPHSMEQFVSPEHLKMIARASGGFIFREDPNLPPHQTGYTNKLTKEIFYNPILAKGSLEHGVKPWRPLDFRGFAYHEAGHHNEEVLAFDERLIEDLKRIEIPEGYQGDPDSEARFIRSIYSFLDNALVDMWLESYMSRRPYFSVRDDISEFQKGKGDVESYKMLSKPEQLIQSLLRSRYFEPVNMEVKLDPEVYESYRKITDTGALEAILNRRTFENYFATKLEKERAIDRKFLAYQQVFLPEYLKLMEKELEDRKKQKQQQKQEGGEEKQQQAQGVGKGPSEAVPLTNEEEQEIVEQIIKQLEEAGKEFQSAAPSDDEKKKKTEKFQEIEKMLKGKAEQKETPQEKEPEREKGLEAIAREGERIRRQQKQERQRGLAENMGVRQETIQRWERIKEKYRAEIESTVASLADVFLEDRRSRLEYLRREGEIVPGLEYETISALISGELDPDTKMSTVRNPEFLETELEWIVDTSTSMGGDSIEKSIDLLVIITEAFKRIRENLAGENLLAEEEEPFRLGATKFAKTPERVTKLKDPINDEKEVKIIEEIAKVGGGTEETEAIREVYQELSLNKNNVIKIIVVLSDGHGDRAGVAPIMRQIEEDGEVVFLAVGLGNEAKAVKETYLGPLRDREKNVFGEEAKDPSEALPKVIEFLKREVNNRRR